MLSGPYAGFYGYGAKQPDGSVTVEWSCRAGTKDVRRGLPLLGGSHHYESLAAKVAAQAQKAFESYRQDELAQSGMFGRARVNMAYDLINPRIPGLAQAAMDTVYNDFARLTLDDLLKALDGYRSAQGMAKP